VSKASLLGQALSRLTVIVLS